MVFQKKGRILGTCNKRWVLVKTIRSGRHYITELLLGQHCARPHHPRWGEKTSKRFLPVQCFTKHIFATSFVPNLRFSSASDRTIVIHGTKHAEKIFNVESVCKLFIKIHAF